MAQGKSHVTYVNIHGQVLDGAVGKAWEERQARLRGDMGVTRRKATVRNGYAAPPGTGPADETCGTCEHKLSHAHNLGGVKHYIKCKLRREDWTHGQGTDILARSPACSKWLQAGRPEVGPVPNHVVVGDGA